MNTQHTPGPWRVYPAGTCIPGYHVHDRIVSDVFNDRSPTDGPSDADLALMAAAPELLAALEVVVADWSAQFERNGHLAPKWCRQARDAIAKATGHVT